MKHKNLEVTRNYFLAEEAKTEEAPLLLLRPRLLLLLLRVDTSGGSFPSVASWPSMDIAETDDSEEADEAEAMWAL